MDIILCNETWQTDDSKMCDLIESFEQTYSSTWTGRGRAGRCGGGVSVITANSFGNVRLLDIKGNGLETVWVLATPHYGQNLTLILSTFYSSSTAEFRPEKDALQAHYLDVVQDLQGQYNRIAFCCGGDLNADTLVDLESLPRFSQVADKPTRDGKELDKLFTDLPCENCAITPALRTANDEVQSDHDIAVCILELLPKPKSNWKRMTRTIVTDQALEEFVQLIDYTDWLFLESIDNHHVNNQNKALLEKLNSYYKQCFKTETFKIKIG